MVRHRFFGPFFGAVCFFALSSSPAFSETLPEAVSAAASQNPAVLQAIASRESVRQDMRIERSAYFPTVSVSTALGRVYGNNSTSRGLSVTRGAGYSNMWEGSLSISQLVFDGLKTPRLVAAAKMRDEAAGFALEDVRETVALRAALSYLDVLRARESLSVLKTYQGTLAQYRSRIEQMVKEGGADTAELEQARSLGLELQGLTAAFEGQLRGAEAEYAQLTGHAPGAEMKKPESVSPDLPVSLEEALAFIARAHPQLRGAERTIAAAEFTEKAQASALVPTVTGELSAYKKDVDDLIGGEVEDNRALLRANWSLSLGGAELARVRRAHEEGVRSRAGRDEALRRLETSVRTAYADLATARRQGEVAELKLHSARALLKSYEAQFEGGKVRVLQLLQAENQTLSARLESIGATYRVLGAEYAVLGGVGNICETLGVQPGGGHGG